MPTHNFLAYVKNIQDWRGCSIITNLHPETVIIMPILLTTDTIELFDYIYSHKELVYNIRYHADNNNASATLSIVNDAKQRLKTNDRLTNTGGNKQLVRAMLYHSFEKDMLIKDISYMWNTLSPEQHHQCIHEPYIDYSEEAAHEINIDIPAIEHRITMQALNARIDRALVESRPVSSFENPIARANPEDIAQIAQALQVNVEATTGRSITHAIIDDIADTESLITYHPGIGDPNE